MVNNSKLLYLVLFILCKHAEASVKASVESGVKSAKFLHSTLFTNSGTEKSEIWRDIQSNGDQISIIVVVVVV